MSRAVSLDFDGPVCVDWPRQVEGPAVQSQRHLALAVIGTVVAGNRFGPLFAAKIRKRLGSSVGWSVFGNWRLASLDASVRADDAETPGYLPGSSRTADPEGDPRRCAFLPGRTWRFGYSQELGISQESESCGRCSARYRPARLQGRHERASRSF